MRKELGKESGQRKTFKATFSRLGKKINYKGYSEDTLLLTRIIDLETGKPVADHIWFSYTRGFESVALKEGDTITFEARIKEYKKGYVNSRLKINQKKTDYKLSHPTKIQVFHAKAPGSAEN